MDKEMNPGMKNQDSGAFEQAPSEQDLEAL